jgi:hypothetical protein
VLPSGFERLADRDPAAAHLADGWLRGAVAGRRGHADDDRIFCHWLHDLIDAFLARAARAGEPARWTPPPGRTAFPAARLHVVREGEVTLVIASGKGGAFRAYRGQRLLRNDTGLIALSPRGERLATHLVDPACEERWEERRVVLRGRFHAAPHLLPTPLVQTAFRTATATLGRVAPNLMRSLLQRMLITGERPRPLAYEREIAWSGSGVEVRDRVAAPAGAARPAELWASSDATSIYVATSNLWQEASLQPWERLDEAAACLRETGSCEIRRSLA